MKDTNESRDKIFRFVEGEKKFFQDIGNSLKETVEQGTVFKEKMPERIVDGENKVSVSTVDELKGHSNRPVVGIFSTTGRAKLRMTAKRDKFEVSTMGAAIHGTAIGGITAVDDLFNVFRDNRSWFYIVFNNFIIIFQHFLYYIHKIIMKQNKKKSKPIPQDSALKGKLIFPSIFIDVFDKKQFYPHLV